MKNSQHANEMDYLFKRSMLIIEYIISKNNYNPILSEFKKAIENSYVKNNVKGLRMLSRDINAWANGLPLQDIKELENILAKQLGENLSGDKIMHTVIKRILKDGRINNVEDYRIVYEYLQDIQETDPFYSNIDELELILKNAD